MFPGALVGQVTFMKIQLGATPASAPKARRLVDDLKDLPSSVREEAALLISELVANAVRHGEFHSSDSIQVEMKVDRTKLRVAVTNPGWGDVPQVRDAGLLDTGGRGLFLVDRLADSWGTEVLEDERIRVWFDLLL